MCTACSACLWHVAGSCRSALTVWHIANLGMFAVLERAWFRYAAFFLLVAESRFLRKRIHKVGGTTRRGFKFVSTFQ